MEWITDEENSEWKGVFSRRWEIWASRTLPRFLRAWEPLVSTRLIAPKGKRKKLQVTYLDDCCWHPYTPCQSARQQPHATCAPFYYYISYTPHTLVYPQLMQTGRVHGKKSIFIRYGKANRVASCLVKKKNMPRICCWSITDLSMTMRGPWWKLISKRPMEPTTPCSSPRRYYRRWWW